MIYIFDKINLSETDFTGDVYSLLSEQRIQKVKRIQSHTGKKASIAVYLLLRLALYENYGISEAVEFEYEYQMKPKLKNYPNIHFSLSHSNNTAACAIAESEIGVDVQQVREVTDKVAARVLTKRELSAYYKSVNKAEYFCEIWTVKESYIKKTGDGLTFELKKLYAANIKEIYTYKGHDYFCSICTQNNKQNNKQNLNEPQTRQIPEIKHIGRNDFEKLFGR